MTEFSAAAELSVGVTDLGAARQQIERELGDIEVSVSAAPGGGGRQPRDPRSGQFRQIKGVEQRVVEQVAVSEDLAELAGERNDLLQEIADSAGVVGGGGAARTIIPTDEGGGDDSILDAFIGGTAAGGLLTAGGTVAGGLLSGAAAAAGFAGGGVLNRRAREQGVGRFERGLGRGLASLAGPFGAPISAGAAVEEAVTDIQGAEVQGGQAPGVGGQAGAAPVGAFGVESVGPILDSDAIAQSMAESTGSAIRGFFGGGQDGGAAQSVSESMRRSEAQRFRLREREREPPEINAPVTVEQTIEVVADDVGRNLDEELRRASQDIQRRVEEELRARNDDISNLLGG